MSPTNHAAYQMGPGILSLEVKEAPYTSPGSSQITIKNGAIAINPVDGVKQIIGNLAFPYLPYPLILGSDVAGTVVEVGSNVTRFKVGDRVLGHAIGLDKASEKHNAEMGFQEYSVLRDYLTSPVPDSVTFEQACVLPLGLSTALDALYRDESLKLPLPSLDPKPANQTVLIWGGSTSVGSCAIQLARASGYDVVTTCSSSNFEYVKALGASQAFDYRSPSVIKDLIAAHQGRVSAGAVSIGKNSAIPCIEVLKALKGGKRFVAVATLALPDKLPNTTFEKIKVIPGMVGGMGSLFVKSKLSGVGQKFIEGSAVIGNNLGRAIYQDYLPQALATGKFVCKPDPRVVGKGLEFVQEAVNLSQKGVSATKVVVSL